MRTISATIALGMAMLLGGCGSVETRGGVACRDVRVTVVNAVAHLEVRPEIEVCSGYSVILRLAPPLAAGNVRTTAKVAANTWLNVTNTAEDNLTINVPEGVSHGPYDYEFAVTGVGMLDPRIVVQ